MSEANLIEKVLEKEKEDIRKIDMEIANIKTKQVNLFNDRLQISENKLDTMVF